MIKFKEWLGRKWQRVQHPGLAGAYQATFNTFSGQVVLQHWMDTVYCSVYEGSDPIALATHNGRRSFLHELLLNLDMAEQPEKYRQKVEVGNGSR